MKYDEKIIGKIIKIEREKRKWTQARLGKELNISGKQISNYEKGEPIPPMGVLLSLCDIFNCELGYLLGEEEYVDGSKLMTKITEYTGLDKETIENIRKITGDEKRCLHFGNRQNELRIVLNKFLSNECFPCLIENIDNLDKCYIEYSTIYSNLRQRLGEELYYETKKYIDSPIDYFVEECETILDDTIYEAKKLFDDAEKKSYSLEYPLKVWRYDVREEFERLIDKLYPK